MKKYSTLLFDLDDTLFDFKRNERESLHVIFNELGIDYSEKNIQKYQKINHALWKQFELGKCSKDEVVNTRFSLFLSELGMHGNGIQLEQRYQGNLAKGSYMIPGAIELLEKMSITYDLSVVSNGVSTTQYARLKKSGIEKFFRNIFVSEEVGEQKPSIGFFNYVFEQIEEKSLSRILIIGDSLTSDIKGGNNVGIDTCWYNPAGVENQNIAEPTYEIRRLEELYSFL